MTYAEKLKDPRWQKRRLEVMQKASFACECCYKEDETLHVHHVLYRKGAQPWEYADAELQCLCHKCHKIAEEARNELLAEIANTWDLDCGILAKAIAFARQRTEWTSQVIISALFSESTLCEIERKCQNEWFFLRTMAEADGRDPDEVAAYIASKGPQRKIKSSGELAPDEKSETPE